MLCHVKKHAQGQLFFNCVVLFVFTGMPAEQRRLLLPLQPPTHRKKLIIMNIYNQLS